MESHNLSCPGCQAALTPAVFNTTDFVACPFCSASLLIRVFPSFYRGARVGRPGDALVDDSTASCFYHEGKKADTVCERCGRFLCSLCDVEFGGQHVCPSCIEAARKDGALPAAQRVQILHDHMALALAVWPLVLFFPLVVISAPYTAYLCIRHWRSPMGMMPRRRWRFVVALILALLEIAGAIAVIVGLSMEG